MPNNLLSPQFFKLSLHSHPTPPLTLISLSSLVSPYILSSLLLIYLTSLTAQQNPTKLSHPILKLPSPYSHSSHLSYPNLTPLLSCLSPIHPLSYCTLLLTTNPLSPSHSTVPYSFSQLSPSHYPSHPTLPDLHPLSVSYSSLPSTPHSLPLAPHSLRLAPHTTLSP